MPTNWPRPPFLNPAFGNNNNVSAVIRNDSARMPLTQNWRFDIQRELPGGTVLEVAYVGTRATHQIASLRNVNQVDASYLSLGADSEREHHLGGGTRREHPDSLPWI